MHIKKAHVTKDSRAANVLDDIIAHIVINGKITYKEYRDKYSDRVKNLVDPPKEPEK